jgi:uracil-DNA glycosylase
MPRRPDLQLRMTPIPKGGPRAWGARCDECPLNGRTPVFGDGSPNAKLAVIGEAPGGQETDRGIPFIGRSGELLELLLSKLGWHRPEIFIDNAVACMPPEGDMKGFLQKAKKELKDAFRSPVDCCRPRLFHALGVPICAGCHRYVEGPPQVRCTCATPLPTEQKGRRSIPVAIYVGNFALDALHGYQGISEKRGYVDWNGRDESRPIAHGGKHNGTKLDVKAWLTRYASTPWTDTTKPEDKLDASSAPQPTSSRRKKALPSSVSASASGSRSKGRRPASSSSPPRRAGKGP